MTKKFIILCFLFVLCLTLSSQKFTAKADGSGEIAIESESGRILFSNNAQAKLPMASTTKIMTALVVIEDCDADEVITVDDRAVGVEGSSIYLKRGEKISVRDLLYGLMLRSGNDAATALAIHHSGSVEKFALAMNNRANTLGLKNTHFCNPSGLPDNNHYTTAYDLCKITQSAMNLPLFKEIVSTKSYNGEYRSFVNKNKMLYRYEGATGVKTGYTVKAGRCLVSSAEREGMSVICVVLNCSDMYERSGKILDNCFENFKTVNIDENKRFLCGGRVSKILSGEKIVVSKNSKIDYKVIENSDKKIKNDGQTGILRIFEQNDLIFEQKLYSIN